MKRYISTFWIVGIALLFLPQVTLAASNSEIEQFTHDTLSSLIGLAALVAALFLVRGGYLYITSTGKPAALDEAKRTIRNALIGLVVVIGASIFSSLLNQAFTSPSSPSLGATIALNPIVPVTPSSSLTQIILDAVTGFLQNIIQSATKPMLDGIMSMLTSVPSLVHNSVVFNFWLTIVGITDSLFALVIALLGFHFMSASVFGFDELPLKELFPRLGLAFVAANTSIFLIDWLTSLCQVMIQAVLHATGGLDHAWVLTAFDPATILSGMTTMLTLLLFVVFILLAVVLMLFYLGRLMVLAVGAVLSPIICLLWVIPKFTGFAESTTKAYLVIVFSSFVHIVIIQLASSFITLPDQVGANPLVSLLVGIALFSLLLKTTTVMLQLILAAQTTGGIQRFGGQILNVLSVRNAAKKVISS